jgi:PTS system cellobiose-specific IIC component
MAIPFFLAPIASVSLGYFLTQIGFCPLFALDAPWTTPLGILGFLDAGGNIMGAVSQLLCFALSIVIYAPFVIAANKVPSEAAEA